MIKAIKAKIADNAYTQEKGLMFVEHMPADEGMLFAFRRAQKLSFWGMNTFIPLDIAFIDEDFRITKISHIKPHSLSSVTSDKACVYALEVNEGYFDNNEIKVGDKCNFADVPRTSHNIEREFGFTVVLFEKEGQTSQLEKDISNQLRNFKKSQSLPVEQPKVVKQDQGAVGEPVTEQVNNVDLPVIDMSTLGNILEDSFDDDNQMQDVQPEVPEETPQEPQKQYPTFDSAYKATEWAEENGEVVRISYTTKHGRSLIRDVEPHGKFHSESTHREILVVFDETIGDIRAFILGNISKWAFVGKSFSKKFIVKAYS